MRISLIRPATPELLDDRLDPPLGLLLLAAGLQKQGHEVDVLDFAGGAQPAIRPADLYGISLYTTSYPEALAVRDRIRSVSASVIVAGGPHATALPLVPLPGTDPYLHPERYGTTWLSPDWKDYFVLQGGNREGYAFEHRELGRDTLRQTRQFLIEALDRVSQPALADNVYR